MSMFWLLVTIQIVIFSGATRAEEPSSLIPKETSQNGNRVKLGESTHPDSNKIGVEPREGDRSFVKDIVERLHALDADIGKLIYNSSSLMGPDDPIALENSTPQKGGEKFTEVLNDLDSLQDEIGILVTNATRTRQYNILIRLRPLNNILYRIRHNLHLMRNSLVAITAVSNLERLGNNVLDATLQAFMRPDANLHEEIGDGGNYDINLDRMDDLQPNSTAMAAVVANSTGSVPIVVASPVNPPSTSTTITTTATSTSTTTTTTTPAPPPSSSITLAPSTTSRPARRTTRQSSRRNNQRRRTTTQAPLRTDIPIVASNHSLSS